MTATKTWWTTQKKFKRYDSSSQKKAKIYHQQIKLLIDTRSDIQLLESNILPLELNLEIFYLTPLTLELAKTSFIMKILS